MTVTVSVHDFTELDTFVADLTKLLSSSQFWNRNCSLPQSVNTSCRYADTANLFWFHRFFMYCKL